MVDSDAEQSRSTGGEVFADKGLQLGWRVRADLVWGAEQRVAEAGAERGLVEHLHCIGCRVLSGQLKLHPGQVPLQLPWLESLVANHIAKVVGSQVCRVPGGLNGV